MKNVSKCVTAAVVGLVLAGGLTASVAGQAPAKAKAAPAAKGAARVVKLVAGANNTLTYDVTTIQAKPGEALEIQLTSQSTLPKEALAHNFVLLSKTVDVSAFVMDAAMAKDTGYIPAKYKKDVLASTAMAGPGETVKVAFTAPKVAGSYTYVCSFAGHYLTGMKGTLVVK